jgi:hypothetical protein
MGWARWNGGAEVTSAGMRRCRARTLNGKGTRTTAKGSQIGKGLLILRHTLSAQPTTTSARLGASRLEPLNTLDGRDRSGNGTEPRIAFHFPEWKNDANAAVFGQQHSTLQSDGRLASRRPAH